MKVMVCRQTLSKPEMSAWVIPFKCGKRARLEPQSERQGMNVMWDATLDFSDTELDTVIMTAFPQIC